MPVWRLVLKKVATLEEIERSWTFMDLLKGNALLDYSEDLEAQETTKP